MTRSASSQRMAAVCAQRPAGGRRQAVIADCDIAVGLVVLIDGPSGCLTIYPLGFGQALFIALRKFPACIGKPKKITCGCFHRHDMLMIKTVCGERSVEPWNVHRRVRVEMRDELVPVPTHLFGEVREVEFLHSQVGEEAGFKGGWIRDNVTPEMFIPVVAEQFAPFKHGYVEKVVTNLAPKSRMRRGWNARLRAGSALSSAKVGDVPCETGARGANPTETFTARQWFTPKSALVTSHSARANGQTGRSSGLCWPHAHWASADEAAACLPALPPNLAAFPIVVSGLPRRLRTWRNCGFAKSFIEGIAGSGHGKNRIALVGQLTRLCEGALYRHRLRGRRGRWMAPRRAPIGACEKKHFRVFQANVQ